MAGMAGLPGNDMRRLMNARPHPENVRPQVERINPTYRQPVRLREPWITLDLGWDLDQVDALIRTSDKISYILNKPIIREVRFAGGFKGKTVLTFQRLYAAIIQSRGSIVNNPVCKRCYHGDQAVFTECVSDPDTGNKACAADTWHKRGSFCAFNTGTGYIANPATTYRPKSVAVANADILAMERAQHGQATAPIEYNQHGRLQDGEAIARLRNRRRIVPDLVYAEERRPNSPDRSQSSDSRSRSRSRHDRRNRSRSRHDRRNRSRSRRRNDRRSRSRSRRRNDRRSRSRSPEHRHRRSRSRNRYYDRYVPNDRHNHDRRNPSRDFGRYSYG